MKLILFFLAFLGVAYFTEGDVCMPNTFKVKMESVFEQKMTNLSADFPRSLVADVHRNKTNVFHLDTDLKHKFFPNGTCIVTSLPDVTKAGLYRCLPASANVVGRFTLTAGSKVIPVTIYQFVHESGIKIRQALITPRRKLPLYTEVFSPERYGGDLAAMYINYDFSIQVDNNAFNLPPNCRQRT